MDTPPITLSPQHLILLMALMAALGKAFKEIPSFPNAFIPLTLAVVGAAAMVGLDGLTASNVIAGILAGLGTTGAHQAVTQLTRSIQEEPKEDDDEPPNP